MNAEVLLASLLVFLLVSFGVFLPVLRLRVCPSCKANQLGICPSFSSRQAKKTLPYQVGSAVPIA
jgi:hypothetical protein